jgi:hypothetical protein
VPVTKTLTSAEAELLRPYSAAHHRLKELVTELEHLALELIDRYEGTDLCASRAVGNRRGEAGR